MSNPLTRALNLKQASIFKLLVTISALLSWVIALGAASGSMLQNLYTGWQLNRASTLTIYLAPDADTTAVTQLQQSLPALAGVQAVTPLSNQQLQILLAPLLANTTSLPLPTVMELTLTPAANREQLTAHIRQTFPTAEIDDHQALLTQVGHAVRNVQAMAAVLAALMLGLMATVIILTTRTGLASQRATVQMLVQLGASDATLTRNITQQITKRVLVGSAIGAAAAAIMLGLATFASPLLAPHISLITWVALILTPTLLLPTLAAATALLSTRHLLRTLS